MESIDVEELSLHTKSRWFKCEILLEGSEVNCGSLLGECYCSLGLFARGAKRDKVKCLMEYPIYDDLNAALKVMLRDE